MIGRTRGSKPYRPLDGTALRQRESRKEFLKVCASDSARAKILKAGYKIKEIPIRYIPRGRAEGKKVRWADGFASLYTLIKYRFRK